MIPGKQYTPDVLVSIAWRRKWLIVVPALVIATAAAAVTYRLPNMYEADTLIMVVSPRVPESYVRPAVAASIDDRLMTISHQILSRTRLERIIQDFNLYADLRARAPMVDIVERMRNDIKVQVLTGDTFRAGFMSSDPRTAMRVAEQLASLFIEENLRDREVLAERTSQFLESQLADARRQLIENEKKLEAYRRRHDGELPTQVEANLQGLHNTEMQWQALTDSISRDRDRRLVLERFMADARVAVDASAPPTVTRTQTQTGDDQLPDSAADQLRTAEATLRETQLRLKPEHPDVALLKLQIAELRKRAETEAAETLVPEGISSTDVMRRNRLNESKAEITNLDQDLASKLAEEKRLRGIVADYQKRIEAAPTRDTELVELTRDYDTFQQVYRELLGKREDSKLTLNLERQKIGERFKVLDLPRLPEKPSSPNRPRLYLMGIAVAFAIGLGLAALVEGVDRTIRSEDDVKAALNLRVLATIPLIPSPLVSKRHRRLVAVSVGIGVAVVVSVAAVAWRLLK